MFDPKSTEKIWGLDSGTGRISIMFDPNILHQWVKHYLLPDDDLPGEKNKLKIICFISCIIEIMLYLCPILITNTNQMEKKYPTKKYQVISPDGFTIEFENPYYTSKKKAIAAFEKWKERYVQQGYYSSVRFGVIELKDLEQYCQIKVM